ncbi:hypothetical protein KC573_04625 [candidate division WWE3 bacterium]|uniref:Uncharacterized protein n=1 Tax=candidate division WWE3 bacterium TaxID=2053526 RepID=A0A955LX00_UNCKA|nr:hypothetical protein [candidate division WWE3 bacterium]
MINQDILETLADVKRVLSEHFVDDEDITWFVALCRAANFDAKSKEMPPFGGDILLRFQQIRGTLHLKVHDVLILQLVTPVCICGEQIVGLVPAMQFAMDRKCRHMRLYTVLDTIIHNHGPFTAEQLNVPSDETLAMILQQLHVAGLLKDYSFEIVAKRARFWVIHTQVAEDFVSTRRLLSD